MTIKQNTALKIIEEKKEFQNTKSGFKLLLRCMKGHLPNNDAAYYTYTLLCDVEALLLQYETTLKQNILVAEVIDDKQAALDYILKLSKEVLCNNV